MKKQITKNTISLFFLLLYSSTLIKKKNDIQKDVFFNEMNTRQQ